MQKLSCARCGERIAPAGDGYHYVSENGPRCEGPRVGPRPSGYHMPPAPRRSRAPMLVTLAVLALCAGPYVYVSSLVGAPWYVNIGAGTVFGVVAAAVGLAVRAAQR